MAQGCHRLSVCLIIAFAPSARLHTAQERGGVRAAAFPVVERLRLALRS